MMDIQEKNKELRESLKYTCIFGGGAIRGVSYAGAIRAMEEIGIHPQTIAGSSVGAIFAGLLAVGYNAQELSEIFMHVNYELFRDIHFGFGKDFAISKGEIFLDWLRELIEKKFYGENYKKGQNKPVTFADIEKNVIIIATDLTNFKPKEFSKFVTPDVEIAYAIRISSTMPGLMKPVVHENTLLVDGDLQKSWPLWRLSKHLCTEKERVLEFRLEGDYEGKGHNAIDFMNTVYSCVTSLATDFIMDTYAHRDKFDYVKINTGTVVVVDFNQSKEKREELINIGYEQTIVYFKSDLVTKKRRILKHYKNLSKNLKKIEQYIDNNKIKLAQNQLGLLYMDVYVQKKEIELKYFNMINEFKDIFMENAASNPLMRMFQVKNKKLIEAKIKKINLEFDKKIKELETYIYKS